MSRSVTTGPPNKLTRLSARHRQTFVGSCDGKRHVLSARCQPEITRRPCHLRLQGKAFLVMSMRVVGIPRQVALTLCNEFSHAHIAHEGICGDDLHREQGHYGRFRLRLYNSHCICWTKEIRKPHVCKRWRQPLIFEVADDLFTIDRCDPARQSRLGSKRRDLLLGQPDNLGLEMAARDVQERAPEELKRP